MRKEHAGRFLGTAPIARTDEDVLSAVSPSAGQGEPPVPS